MRVTLFGPVYEVLPAHGVEYRLACFNHVGVSTHINRTNLLVHKRGWWQI